MQLQVVAVVWVQVRRVVTLDFCMGQDDVVAIIEAPDDESMAAATLIIGGSGAFSGGATTKLMTAPQAMSAMQKAQAGRASYKPATG